MDLVCVEVLCSHARLVFEVLCLTSVAYVSDAIYQMQENNKEKNAHMGTEINFITKIGTTHGEHKYRDRR